MITALTRMDRRERERRPMEEIMRRLLITSAIGLGVLFGALAPTFVPTPASAYYYHHRYYHHRYYHHRYYGYRPYYHHRYYHHRYYHRRYYHRLALLALGRETTATRSRVRPQDEPPGAVSFQLHKQLS